MLQTFFSLAGPMVQAELEGVVEDEDDEEEQGEEGKDGEEEAGPVLLRTAAAALAQELQASWLDLLYVRTPFIPPTSGLPCTHTPSRNAHQYS